jgi:hypothetical protein
MGFYGPQTGSKLGLLGPKHCQIHQNCVSPVIIIGLYDQGPNWGYRAQNGVLIGF